jgi:hypothetical protein
VFKQGNAFGKTPMINLSSSSDEENIIVDTSRNTELTKKFFGNLNCDILRLPGDSKIIILDDSNEENEAQEEKTIDIKSMAVSAPTGANIYNSDDQELNLEADGSDCGECSTGEP